jgi:thiamine-monophosphate kinase
MGPDELTIIDRYFRPLAGEGAFRLFDDAGRLGLSPDWDVVVTADMIAAGVHFLPDDPPDTIAGKALRVNLSDLAAKGARPLSYTLSLGVSAELGERWLANFAEGLRRDQDRFGIGLLGGDTISVAQGPVIAITAIGLAPKGKMVHRFGGSAGDALYVSGVIGAGAAGLALLKRNPGPWDELSPERREELVRRFRLPEPRVSLAAALADFAAASIDVSDGLVGDCDKLAAASRCSAEIHADAVPFPAGLDVSHDEAMLARLLTGGDDYEILAAVPRENEAGFRRAAQAANVPVARIGALTPGSAPTEVLVDGRPLELTRRSYVHGRFEWTA